MTSLSELTALRNTGLRLTPQRLAIYRALAADEEHPTAQTLYERLRPDYPSLSLTTVYNTLESLARLGVINVLRHMGEGPARYDANTSPHAHVLCLHCGRLIDFESPVVPELDADVAARSGHSILGSYLLYYGLCTACAKPTAPPLSDPVPFAS